MTFCYLLKVIISKRWSLLFICPFDFTLSVVFKLIHFTCILFIYHFICFIMPIVMPQSVIVWCYERCTSHGGLSFKVATSTTQRPFLLRTSHLVIVEGVFTAVLVVLICRFAVVVFFQVEVGKRVLYLFWEYNWRLLAGGATHFLMCTEKITKIN